MYLTRIDKLYDDQVSMIVIGLACYTDQSFFQAIFTDTPLPPSAFCGDVSVYFARNRLIGQSSYMQTHMGQRKTNICNELSSHNKCKDNPSQYLTTVGSGPPTLGTLMKSMKYFIDEIKI